MDNVIARHFAFDTVISLQTPLIKENDMILHRSRGNPSHACQSKYFVLNEGFLCGLAYQNANGIVWPRSRGNVAWVRDCLKQYAYKVREGLPFPPGLLHGQHSVENILHCAFRTDDDVRGQELSAHLILPQKIFRLIMLVILRDFKAKQVLAAFHIVLSDYTRLST